jgi:hypothetical protein
MDDRFKQKKNAQKIKFSSCQTQSATFAVSFGSEEKEKERLKLFEKNWIKKINNFYCLCVCELKRNDKNRP